MSPSKRSADPQYLEYLAAAAEGLKHIKQRSYLLMHLHPGHRVLDVGCGPGIDTTLLAHLVGPTGHVSGIDADQAMLAEAEKRAAGARVRGWVTHHQGEATALPFETASFDACRSDRVFQHLPRSEDALAEMIRVTTSGGWIVVVDTDWGTCSLDTLEVDIERRLARFDAAHRHANGYAGRQLYRLFTRQQLTEITVEPFVIHSTTYRVLAPALQRTALEQAALAAGAVTTDDLRRLHADLERTENAGGVFGSINLILVAGRKP